MPDRGGCYVCCSLRQLHRGSGTSERTCWTRRRGRVATVRRDSARTAVVDVERLRHFLASIVPSRAQVVSETGGWSVFIPGLPVAADVASFDEAITEMIAALREYAEDWQQRLLDAPNHRDNWGWSS
jgi:hypothetical protein